MSSRRLAVLVVAATALTGCAAATRPAAPLHQVAATGDVQALAAALDRGADPGAPEPAASGAIGSAGWADVKRALELPYVYRAPTPAGPDLRRTPLHFAAAAGTVGALDLLLRRGADIEARDTRGHTALHYAAGFDRRDAVLHLLDRGSVCDSRDGAGWTPLHVAASQGALRAATVLLDRCGGVDERTVYYADTPLHLAALGGRREVVELLLARGADPGARSKLGWTPAEVASARGYPDLAGLLESRNGGGSALPVDRHPGLP